MSLGYAEKLSYREDLGGQLGAPEHFDQQQELDAKIAQLVSLVKQAKRIVAFTGAGISTACGIPDFRGPNGIWTLQRSKKPLPQMKTTFVAARPSYTHQALVALQRCGKLSYIVSQNVDGLHLRSGIPRGALAELHGNCFAERCEQCGAEYVRDFEIETVGFHCTKRHCTQAGCGGRLRDHILDWEDALPPDELELSEQHAREADLAICLGTSLQITPACNLPLLTLKAGGKMVIVNLQKTPKDKKASLVIHARCDDVMRRVMAGARLAAAPYTRTDTVAIALSQHSPRLKPSTSTPGLRQPAAVAAAETAEPGDSGDGSEGEGDGEGAQQLAAGPNDSAGPSSHAGGGSSSAGGASMSGVLAVKEEASTDASLRREISAVSVGGSEGAGAAPAASVKLEQPEEAADAPAASLQQQEQQQEQGEQRGSYPFTLSVTNQHGPKWPVPLLERVEFEFQDPQLKPGAKGQAPFSITRTARQPGDYPATITLHLSNTADEGRRVVRLEYTVRLRTAQEQQQQQQGGAGSNGAAGSGGRRQGGIATRRQRQQQQQQQQERLWAEQQQLVSFVTQVVDYDKAQPAGGAGPSQLAQQSGQAGAGAAGVAAMQQQPQPSLAPEAAAAGGDAIGTGASDWDAVQPGPAKRPRQDL